MANQTSDYLHSTVSFARASLGIRSSFALSHTFPHTCSPWDTVTFDPICDGPLRFSMLNFTEFGSRELPGGAKTHNVCSDPSVTPSDLRNVSAICNRSGGVC